MNTDKLRLLFWVVLILGSLILAGLAQAQSNQTVTIVPVPGTSAGGGASGSITGASTSVFQKVFSAAPAGSMVGQGARKGCLIQNNSAGNVMFLTEGLGTVGSSATNSIQIAKAGGTFSCQQGSVVLIGEIDLAGTQNDAFVAWQW